MATNYYNTQLAVVDGSGNVNVVYPITKAANVDLSATSYNNVESYISALNGNLTTSDNVPFRFGKDSNGKYGYIINEGGADTVIPFKNSTVTVDGVEQDRNFDLSTENIYYDNDESVGGLPYDFYYGSAVIYNNEIHILGSGYTGYYNKHYKWDGSSWISVSTLPYDFYYGSAVVYNNEIHILGSGSSSSNYTKHYKWNGSSWISVSTLPYNFYNGCAVVYNNEIHILGSSDSGNTYKAHYKWNGSSWSSVSLLPYNFFGSSAVVYNNEIHILGSYASSVRTNHYKWNGSSWSSVSTLPYNFQQGSAVVYNNEIHILGSSNSGNYINHYKYYANNNAWGSVSTLPYNFYNGCAVVYNSYIHILGGTSSPIKYYRYNNNKWMPYQNLSISNLENIFSKLPYKFKQGSAVVYNNGIHILGCKYSGGETLHYKYNTDWLKAIVLYKE